MTKTWTVPRLPSGGRAVWWSCATLVASIVATAVPAGAATASELCGSTLTSDLTLHADLECSGSGLRGDPDHEITIDLNGFTLTGSGSGVGVTLNSGTLKNGVVEGFETGVRATYASVQDIEIRNSDVGFHGGALQGPIVRSRIVDNRIGILADILSLAIEDSEVVRNGTGIFWQGRGLWTVIGVTRSRIAHNGVGFSMDSGGMFIEDSVFVGNDGSMGGETTLSAVRSSFRNSNLLTRNAGNVVLRDNRFIGSGAHVISDGTTFNYDLGATTVAIERNTITHGLGLRLEHVVGDWPIIGTVAGNRLINNAGTGLFAATVLLPSSLGLTVRDNTSIANREHGFWVAGVVDGGGNVARANRLGQCVGLAC